MGIPSRRFGLLLGAILLIGAAVRVPGVFWPRGAGPEGKPASYHPDEQRFIRAAATLQSTPAWGYVPGMKCHLFVVKKTVQALTGRTPDLILSIRIVSILYGLLTILLLAFLVREAAGRDPPALFAAALLSLAPLHGTYSHIGTADVASLFWFLLALFLARRYAADRSADTWTLLAAATGACLSIKFAVPVLLPIVSLLLTDPKRGRRALQGALAGAGAFALLTLFIYRPHDFLRFLNMLAVDNVNVQEAKSAWTHLARYGNTIFPALGVPGALLALGGTALLLFETPGRARARLRGTDFPGAARAILVDPNVLWLAPFLLHLLLALRIGVHAPRHILPLLVPLCAAGGVAADRLTRREGARRRIASVFLAIAGVYLAGNAVAWEVWYLEDIRADAARWLEENRRPGETATAFVGFSRLRGAVSVAGGEETTSRPSSDWFVTCDLEYDRYFRYDDASRIFHAWGGQSRLDFYRELFDGRTEYREAKEFHARNWSPEQALVSRGIFEHLGKTVPRRCVIYRREDPAGG